MPWRQSQYAATPLCCSHCFPLIAFMFLGCASPSKFPASLPSLHRSVIFSVSVRDHVIWITEQCKLFMILFLIYHIIVKPALIQKQANFQALNFLLFLISGAKIHSYLRALQGTDIFADSRFTSGVFSHKETRWEYLIISFLNFCASVNIVGSIVLLGSWAAKWLLTNCWLKTDPSSLQSLLAEGHCYTGVSQ